MAPTREPRRRQNKAMVRYLQHLAKLARAERPKDVPNKDIADEMGLSAPQFSQALNGRTSSTDVARAFARKRSITIDELEDRAEQWYREHRLASLVDEAVVVVTSEEDCESLVRRIRSAWRERSASDSSRTRSNSG